MRNLKQLRFTTTLFCLFLSGEVLTNAQSTHNSPPTVKIVYFIPSDCQPLEDRHERLGRVMKHIQDFYRDGMEKQGYGPMTFALEWDSPNRMKIHDVRGKKRQAEYGRNDAGVVRNEVRDALRAQGVNVDQEVIVIFQLLLKWEDGKATELGPYVGGGSHHSGTAWVYDDALLDAASLPSKEPGGYYHGRCSIGQFNSHYIGGVAHEMGHAFSLPHDCQLNSESQPLGTSLMGSGNHPYGKEERNEGKGTFLSASTAMRLSKVRAFAGDLPDANKWEQMRFVRFAARYANNEIMLAGQVADTPPLVGIIAYNDNENIGADYDAKSWVAKLDDRRQFRLTIGELEQAPYQLRLVGVHVNGMTSSINVRYTVGKDGPDIAAVNAMVPLQQLKETWLAKDKDKLRNMIASLEKRGESYAELLRKAKHLEQLWNLPAPKSPATIPANQMSFDLSDAEFVEAKTGWGGVRRRMVPEDVLIEIGDNFFESGLYAHAPSLFRVRLDKKWETFETGCGLQNGHGGSVVFVVKGDGKELFRSDKITARQFHRETVSVKGIDVLELIVEDAGDGNNSDWGMWVEPTLRRKPPR
jgi:hypothetical protein